MEKIQFIRQSFLPLQPGADGRSNGQLQYQTFQPSEALQPYVAYYWELKSSEKLLDYAYQVVADGAVDLIFNCEEAEESVLSVTNKQAFTIPLSGKVHYLGVRFLPGGVHYFFDLPLTALTGLTLDSGNFITKKLINLELQLLENTNIIQRLIFLEHYLLQQFQQRRFNADPRLLQSLYHILQSAGNAPIQEKVADWISPRQLRRLFEYYIGLNPKTFARIVRFQQTLNAMQRTKPSDWKGIYYHYGYFDQAHFIRECKTFYGDTPKVLTFSTI